jgi:hypothetical protein
MRIRIAMTCWCPGAVRSCSCSRPRLSWRRLQRKRRLAMAATSAWILVVTLLFLIQSGQVPEAEALVYQQQTFLSDLRYSTPVLRMAAKSKETASVRPTKQPPESSLSDKKFTWFAKRQLKEERTKVPVTAPSRQSRPVNSSTNTVPNRRQLLSELTLAAAGLSLTYAGTHVEQETDYPLWGILPVGTYKSKTTVMETIVPNQLWTYVHFRFSSRGGT